MIRRQIVIQFFGSDEDEFGDPIARVHQAAKSLPIGDWHPANWHQESLLVGGWKFYAVFDEVIVTKPRDMVEGDL